MQPSSGRVRSVLITKRVRSIRIRKKAVHDLSMDSPLSSFRGSLCLAELLTLGTAGPREVQRTW